MDRKLTPTNELLFFEAENERVRSTDPVYFVYEDQHFMGAHTSQKTINDLNDNTMVFECHKARRESHRIF